MKLMAALLIAIVCATQVCVARESSCARPEINNFLEKSRDAIQFQGTYFPHPHARFLPLNIEGQDVQWMGASWTGPLGGAIFLLDCSGKPIAAANLGAVKNLRLGPVLPVGQTVEIVFVSGTGTGVYQTSVGLAVLQASSINILWNHLAFDREAFASGGYDYTDRHQWKFSPDGKEIVVTGLRKVGAAKEFEHGWKPGTTHALPIETYCWKAAEDKFDVCP